MVARFNLRPDNHAGPAICDALLPKLLSGEVRVKEAEKLADGAV